MAPSPESHYRQQLSGRPSSADSGYKVPYCYDFGCHGYTLLGIDKLPSVFGDAVITVERNLLHQRWTRTRCCCSFSSLYGVLPLMLRVCRKWERGNNHHAIDVRHRWTHGDQWLRATTSVLRVHEPRLMSMSSWPRCPVSSPDVVRSRGHGTGAEGQLETAFWEVANWWE